LSKKVALNNVLGVVLVVPDIDVF
jgi:hypothetical protein